MIQFITIILAILFCGFYAEGSEIKNASSVAMPIAKVQSSGEYTAYAKKGYTFAVKNNRVCYMSKERAKELGATLYRKSADALASIVGTPRKTSMGATGL